MKRLLCWVGTLLFAYGSIACFRNFLGGWSRHGGGGADGTSASYQLGALIGVGLWGALSVKCYRAAVRRAPRG